MRFFKVSLVVLLLMAGSSSGAAEDSWSEVDLSFKLVKHLTLKECHKEKKAFIACAQTLNQMLAYLEKPYVLITNNIYETDAAYGKVIKSFPNIKVIGKKEYFWDNFVDLFQQQRQDRLDANESWTELFDDAEGFVRFDLVTNWILYSFVTKENESGVTGTALNAYYHSFFDPHTSLIPATYYSDMRKGDQSYFGIGATIKKINNGIVIEQPMEGSPALKAGLKPNDIITHIDGEDIRSMSLQDAIALIKGGEGSVVTLTILRNEYELEIDVIRGKITRKNINVKILSERGNKIVYLKYNQFANLDDCEEIKEQLTAADPFDGLIFDLRGNPGGELQTSVCIASIFLDDRQVVTEIKDLAGTKILERHYSKTDMRYEGPMVVLINGHSASASELVSGALQDYEAAVVIGERSYGKGSVQNVRPWMAAENVYFKKTIARFYRPSGITNQIQGIHPDMEVFTSPDPTEEEKFVLREEDNYINALPAIGEKWEQPRPDYMEDLDDCAQDSGTADNYYQDNSSHQMKQDYQLLVAKDIMTCLVTWDKDAVSP